MKYKSFLIILWMFLLLFAGQIVPPSYLVRRAIEKADDKSHIAYQFSQVIEKNPEFTVDSLSRVLKSLFSDTLILKQVHSNCTVVHILSPVNVLFTFDVIFHDMKTKFAQTSSIPPYYYKFKDILFPNSSNPPIMDMYWIGGIFRKRKSTPKYLNKSELFANIQVNGPLFTELNVISKDSTRSDTLLSIRNQEILYGDKRILLHNNDFYAYSWERVSQSSFNVTTVSDYKYTVIEIHQITWNEEIETFEVEKIENEI